MTPPSAQPLMFNLGKPPFSNSLSLESAALAQCFTNAFSLIPSLNAPLTATLAAILCSLGAADDLPLVRAAQSLARDIDEGIGAGTGNAYHNRQHFCEVMLGAYYLTLGEALTVEDQLMVVFAAMAHDFQHDGQLNGTTPLRLERKASEASSAYLLAAGVHPAQRDGCAALILATDISIGIPALRAAHFFHQGKAARPECPAVAPELARFVDSPRLTRQALMLVEADILPSVGLTIEHALLMQTRLSAEWRQTLTLQDKYRFMKDFFPGFIVSTAFQRNVEQILETLAERIARDES